ncbi:MULTISPECIES: bifunctional methylenetetrahydrofolate dehydrogenase/methenyltetrahydrofolate cyclohydrolase FolD [Culturomica]|jgi:methylenetetrahydrofolate dehydrogenase (NADP+)/methenyltetrahydrofolate cyclohydrolase|uniref:bifunctional methylenetetrahydrofolate dehydrogenase/methenyltetrahydrofolate cyclohydrolase FolD n=1 Tax=Culturomica TaxID=1926651 RepID=UPI000337DEF6|nr:MULTISPECIES: bifunctional methylenetetrahydrofolate dehydrogenase/methenyltetrahydrofolate cyclohydrolase FolD [Culturomica]CCZ09877.1 bifunctional protein FolD [Odoribacter sp. CAG:788]HBO26005.1 bifunctional methylenetetrahydrofolate dehydrogenase/methenyltetrahydrofolate cyclohydrolase FolD [Culturomica sp.]
MELIDGKKISAQIKQELADEVVRLKAEGKKVPHLVAVLVGNDAASETYVASKVKACREVGFKSTELRYSADMTEEQLLEVVEKLNADTDVDGYIVQLPLPKHISEQKILLAIDPDKDVDGFHPCNVGKMVTGLPTYLPATPAGIVELLKRYHIPTQGKHCVVIGRSNIVGTPMSVLMSRKAEYADCTVTICHSRTPDIKEYTLQADILIVALGKPHFVTADMVKEGAVVVDVGIHRIASDKTKSGFRLAGDVDFENVAPKCSYITPVPGGVGPMTIVSLLQNTLKACKGLV